MWPIYLVFFILCVYICNILSVAHTDVCSGVDLPEVEIVSLLAEDLPRYTLRADHVFGYEHDDWLHTPLLPPEAALGLTYEQIDETLKYFRKSALFYFLKAFKFSGCVTCMCFLQSAFFLL